MLGILVWFILIFVIITLELPSVILGGILIIFAFYCSIFLYYWIVNRIADRKERKREEREQIEDNDPMTREEVIDAWEQKWGRRHPTRKNN